MSPAAKKRQPVKTTEKQAGFTAEEKAAMRARAKELKAAEDGESAVRAALAAMSPQDRKLGERLHALIKESAPELSPKTWYGMPAYAKGGKIVCFFQAAAKVKTRYATRGFSDSANLDEGAMWPVTYALKSLSAAEASKITALIKASAPGLSPRLWYGMPAYAKGGKIVCHFQPAQKFKTRYATLGFSDKANLDEGDMWPTAFAVTELAAAMEARIGALVKKAAG